jgi:hypothetical protein
MEGSVAEARQKTDSAKDCYPSSEGTGSAHVDIWRIGFRNGTEDGFGHGRRPAILDK